MPTLGPFWLRLTSRLETGGKSCCPNLSHTDSTHTHSHITITFHHHHHLGQHQSTGVQPTGRITSNHISRHIRSSGCTISRVHATPRTDGGTPRRFPILAFSSVLAFTDYISSGRDRRGTAEQKSELGLLFASEYPICTFHQRYISFLAYGSWALFLGHRARQDFHGGRALLGGRYKVTSRIHSFAFA